jgi:hypothetical protein
MAWVCIRPWNELKKDADSKFGARFILFAIRTPVSFPHGAHEEDWIAVPDEKEAA